MATEVARSLKEINAEVVKLDGNVKGLTTQNKALDKSLRLDPSSTVLLTQKTENLKTQLSLATQKVQALKDAQIQMRIQVQNGKSSEEEFKKLTIEVAKAEAQVKSFTAEVQKSNNQKLTNLQNSVSGVSNAATVALASIAALGYKYAETGDKVSIATAKYKIGAEAFQQGAFKFDRTTGNADGYAQALENVQKQMSAVAKGSTKAITAFEAVGISMAEMEGKSSSEVLDLILGKLGAIADEDERLTLANALLSTAGYDVAQVAGLTAEEIQALNEKLAENGILTQEEADKAAALKDKWEDFQSQMQAVMMDLGESLLPLLESLIEIASILIPIIAGVASVFGSMPKPLQFIVAILLVLLMALPKLIAIIKAVNAVMLVLSANPMSLKIMLICAAVALLIMLLFKLANLIGGIFGKSYELDMDTSSLGVDIAGLTGDATTPGKGVDDTTNTTTNYYDYSTTNVEAHTDADIDDIAEQLSTKIKVGGGK